MPISCFVLGNCQGQFLSSALATIPGWETFAIGRRFGFDPIVGGRKPQYAPNGELWPLVREAKRAGRVCILLEQVTPMAPMREYGANEALLDRKILFPHVQCQSLWPERFLRADLVEQVSASRLFAQDLAVLKRTQTKADFLVDLRTFVAEESVEQVLFYNWGHPTGPLLAQILSGVLRRLDGLVSDEDGQRLVQLIEESGGIDNITSHPVSPQRVEAAGFVWGASPAYQGWASAVAHYRNREFELASAAARSSVEADPANGFVWGLLGQSLERSDAMDEAEGALRIAVGLLPNTPNLITALGRHLLRKRMPVRALYVALDGMDRFPTDVTMYGLAVEAQVAARRNDEAVAIAMEAVRRSRAHGPTYLRMLDVLRRANVDQPIKQLHDSMVAKLPNDAALQAFAT